MNDNVLYHSPPGFTSIPDLNFREFCWCEGDLSPGMAFVRSRRRLGILEWSNDPDGTAEATSADRAFIRQSGNFR